MNTCTPHPRGAFMLEPVGISPMETLLPGNQKGEALDVGAWWEGRVGTLVRSPVPASSGLASLPRHLL